MMKNHPKSFQSRSWLTSFLLSSVHNFIKYSNPNEWPTQSDSFFVIVNGRYTTELSKYTDKSRQSPTILVILFPWCSWGASTQRPPRGNGHARTFQRLTYFMDLLETGLDSTSFLVWISFQSFCSILLSKFNKYGLVEKCWKRHLLRNRGIKVHTSF